MRKPLALTPLLLPAAPLLALEHLRYDTSYQVYDESAGRMFIESWYYRGEMQFTEETSFRFQLLSDAISGSSPTGALPGSSQPFLAEITDLRRGVLGALSQQIGDHRVEVEYSYSKEQDYLSQGLSLSDRWELNQKNTTVTFGFNYLNDTIVVIGTDDQKKESFDFLLGVNQVLDKNTVLGVTLTIGYSEGYLNDQYKAIQRTDIVSVGPVNIPVTNIYRENRPSSRLRGVLQFKATHFMEKFKAALDSTLRLSQDDYGVFSQSLQIEWRQSLGSKFELTPFFRYYRQNEADFFYNSLDEVPKAKAKDYPDGSGPNYSADYRLSAMSTLSLGLKTRYQVSENISLTAAYEHYDMSGYGSHQAPAASFITASMWTFGATIQF